MGKRIVIKVGTSTLTHESGYLDLRNMEHLVRTLADLEGLGHEVILVSSGAIGMGVGKLSLGARPTDMPTKQAAAAVGLPGRRKVRRNFPRCKVPNSRYPSTWGYSRQPHFRGR